MKVFIASAANLDIDQKYLELATNVSEVFAKNNFDLLFGAGYYSMMGECYKVFKKYKRKIYAFTVSKWERDFKKIPYAKRVKTSDTLMRFRKLYFAGQKGIKHSVRGNEDKCFRHFQLQISTICWERWPNNFRIAPNSTC